MAVDLKSKVLLDSASSTGIWNTTDGQIEAGVAPLSPSGSFLNFGDGVDGDFSDGSGVPLARSGLTISGLSVTANTDVKAEYHFTSFNLSAGYTLTVTGAKPLVIRVTGTATVAGTINSNGASGTDNGTSGAGNRTIGLIAGGSGGAGGGAGGVGGQITAGGVGTAGSAGFSGELNSHGGGLGTNTSVSLQERGGGGGCHDVGAVVGQNTGGAAGVCSAAATNAASFDTSFGGGAGGGGGGACTTGSCAGVVGGAGGGGGGGAIQIVANKAITLSGSINVNGGSGGHNNADNAGAFDCGGGGGGGSGGAVWLQSASDVLNPGGGSVSFSGGAGGIAQLTCNGAGYDGGAGSGGVFRVDAKSNAFGAAHLSKLTGLLSGSSSVVVSKALDFSQATYNFDSVKETPGCGTAGTLKVTYEGSKDGTTFSSPVVGANISQLNGSSFIRFLASITPSGTTPPCLAALSIQYHQAAITQFTLRGSPFLCGRISTDTVDEDRDKNAPPLWISMIGDLFIFAACLLYARLKA